MPKADILPYSVLIIDDEEDVSGWGDAAKATLELEEFEVTHVVSCLGRNPKNCPSASRHSCDRKQRLS